MRAKNPAEKGKKFKDEQSPDVGTHTAKKAKAITKNNHLVDEDGAADDANTVGARPLKKARGNKVKAAEQAAPDPVERLPVAKRGRKKAAENGNTNTAEGDEVGKSFDING